MKEHNVNNAQSQSGGLKSLSWSGTDQRGDVDDLVRGLFGFAAQAEYIGSTIQCRHSKCFDHDNYKKTSRTRGRNI
jgi:hypothetical protein